LQLKFSFRFDVKTAWKFFIYFIVVWHRVTSEDRSLLIFEERFSFGLDHFPFIYIIVIRQPGVPGGTDRLLLCRGRFFFRHDHLPFIYFIVIRQIESAMQCFGKTEEVTLSGCIVLFVCHVFASFTRFFVLCRVSLFIEEKWKLYKKIWAFQSSLRCLFFCIDFQISVIFPLRV